MRKLFDLFVKLLSDVKPEFKRYLYKKIDWSAQYLLITGAKSVGKTTMVLQYVDENLYLDESILYIELDNFYFVNNSLAALTESFVTNNGKLLILDNIHKYADFDKELIEISKKYTNLKMILIGPSVKEYDDLINALVIKEKYELKKMSFREYINLEKGTNFEAISYEDIINEHLRIAKEIVNVVLPSSLFTNYLTYGVYPWGEAEKLYEYKLLKTISSVIEEELLFSQNIDSKNIVKIKELVYLLATDSSYKPNISKLSENISATRGTILQYLDYLNRARVLNLLKVEPNSSYLAKPEMVFFNNSNLLLAFNPSIDELELFKTFFFNQVSGSEILSYAREADFMVNERDLFSIMKDAQYNMDEKKKIFIVENMNIGYENRIPIWLFGFLY